MEAAETWVCTLLSTGAQELRFAACERDPRNRWIGAASERSGANIAFARFRDRASNEPLGPEFKRIRLEELSEATLRHALALRDSSA